MADSHKIPANVLNSNVDYCIDEYVRLRRHREMLRDKWFEGLSLEAIAERYSISLTATKQVIYGIGDDILIRAANMTRAQNDKTE